MRTRIIVAVVTRRHVADTSYFVRVSCGRVPLETSGVYATKASAKRAAERLVSFLTFPADVTYTEVEE